jgi:hypothetical protein
MRERFGPLRERLVAVITEVADHITVGTVVPEVGVVNAAIVEHAVLVMQADL